MNDRYHRQPRLPISRARYQLVPLLSDLFAKQSFSEHRVDQILKENHFTTEDRVLFTELFYGFLRFGHRLLFFVDKFLSNPQKLPEKAKWILAVAFYQKLYMTQIPEQEIIREALEMTKHFLGEGSIVDYMNAVLEKFMQNAARFQKIDDYPLWVQTSFPEWLSDYLSEMWTPIKFFQMANALNVNAPTYIRVNVTKISEEKLILKLSNENIACLQTPVPNCLLLQDPALSPKDVPGYHQGLWTIQNMASQRVIRHLDVKEGDVILDACAGYGGKTLQMAELTRDKAEIHYYDVVEKKMHAIQVRSEKMGFRRVKPVENFEPIYNKVLIDAPCSGLGTISSHPEIKWFRTLKDLEEQRNKQMEVMTTYSQYLKPGGHLLYAACSIDKHEGEEIIKKFLEANNQFVLDKPSTPFLDTEFGTYLLPTEKGESGYFFSRLVKKG